ncbi:hypothetical protein Tco_0054216 [Tanacetum coccineum]
MRTRSKPVDDRQPQDRETSVESSNLENPEILTYSYDGQIIVLGRNYSKKPTEGYEDAIVIPESPRITLRSRWSLNLGFKTSNFVGHIRRPTFSHPIISTRSLHEEIPKRTKNSVKLMHFPFFSQGASPYLARKRTPLGRIETWDDLVSKIINKFFRPLKRQISEMKSRDYQQKFDGDVIMRLGIVQ